MQASRGHGVSHATAAPLRWVRWSAVLLISACTTSDGETGRDAQVTSDTGVSSPADAGQADAGGPADPPGPKQAFERALEQADSSCERDSDCALLEVRALCLGLCDLVALPAADLDPVRDARDEAVAHCSADQDPEPVARYVCTSEGYKPVCRDRRCEYAPDPCSPGCTLEGDTCVGPQGVICERCPEPGSQVEGQPCQVLGHLCHEGPCVGLWECIPDRSSDAGGLVWAYLFADCIR